MNFLFKAATLLAIAALTGCSSGIDPSLQQQIDYQSASTEELLENYEELNEQLVEVIEEKNYYYNKLIKSKNAYREVNGKITSRKNRITSIESPKVKEGEEAPPVSQNQLESHREKLTEYEEELAEIQEEMDKYLAMTKELTAKELKLRPARNKAYDAYINSREELKNLNKKAEKQASN